MENNSDNHEFDFLDEEIKFDPIGEESEEELEKIDTVEFSQAVIWGTDWTAETIATQLQKGNIDLNPKFQRRDAWSDKEKSRFIESLILGFPVPPIILAENKEKRNSYIVIDGKQRLLSIRRFYSTLTDVEFRKGLAQESESFVQLRLRGLEILTSLNGMSKYELENNCSDYMTNFENQTVRTIVIKNWPNETFLYSVFLRLNTGSKKLSPQELRQALHPGAFLSYLDDVTTESEVMKKLLNNKGADPRMKDIELALRFFAYQYSIADYEGNLKVFFDHTCRNLNKSWAKDEDAIRKQYSALEEAITCASDIFSPKNPFCRYRKGNSNDRFSRAIFEILTYYLAIDYLRESVKEVKEEFKRAFIEINDDRNFELSVSESTHNIGRIIIRFSKIEEIICNLSTVKGRRLSIPAFVQKESKIEVTYRLS